ncbi:O-antigen ligase family protein [Rhodococcus daqingensis]|uniref:O-antigen ligase family protein n=1 Tax=Rhodococcus daqingensis TaxID=2479363 RepID=A0ABW2RRN1_9NOCA
MSLALALVGGVALIVAAVVATLIYARPQRGLLFLAALTPLHGVLAIVPGGASLTIWKEALIALTLACAFLRRPRSADPRGARRIPVHMPWWPALAILAVLGSVSALVSFGVLGLVAIKVTFFYLVVVGVLWLAPFDARDRDHLVTVIMAMGAFAALAGLAQQVIGPAYLVELGYQYGQQVRAAGGFFRTFGTFNQPFAFGLYVMLSLLVGGAVALAEPRRVRNTVFLCLTPIMAFAMTTSIVRASILGLAVGLVWLAVLRFRVLLVVLGGTAVLAAMALPFVPVGVTRALFSSSSLGERGEGWNDILTSIAVHPLGRGLGASGSAADRMLLADGAEMTNTSPNYQPDNYYVKMLLELGPIGLWLVLALLITALVWTTRLGRELPGRDGAFALGVSASVVAAMTASVVATYFEIFPLDLYFWLLLGVVGCAAAQHRSDSEPLPSAPGEAESRPMPVSC